MKRSKGILSSVKGMTLSEILVAMALIVLIIMVFTPAFLSYYQNIRTAGQVTQKTYERASLMERLVANKGDGNAKGYETEVTGIPLKLSSASGSAMVDFSTADYGDIKGRVILESPNR